MTQKISTQYQALDTSSLHNERFVNVIHPGVYSGYKLRPNPGQPNLLDLTTGNDDSSVLVTNEGIRIEETATVKAVVAIEPADATLTRLDLVVATYVASTDSAAQQVYEVIKGKNQASVGTDPVRPKPTSEFQIPIAYITVRPQKSFSGVSKAKVDTTDVLHVVPASTVIAPTGIGNLKPELAFNDKRRLFVYEGILPNAQGTKLLSFFGGYSDPLIPSDFGLETSRYFLIGLNDELEVKKIGSAISVDLLPEFSTDTLPLAIVKASVISGVPVITEVQDVRFLFARNLAPRNETIDYKSLLGDSVFKYLRIVEFTTSDDVDLTTVKLLGGTTSSLLSADIDTTDSSLAITWAGTTITPPSAVEIVSENLFSGDEVASTKHFMLAADAYFAGLRFSYSTSSKTSGFSPQTFRPNELVRIDGSAASKLYLKLIIPAAGFVSGSVAKILSLGVLYGLDDEVLNSATVVDLGIESARLAVRPLIFNSEFAQWSIKTSNDDFITEKTVDTVSFPLSKDNGDVLLADGWQMTEFNISLVGDRVQRVVDGSVPSLEFTTDAAASGVFNKLEYRVPKAYELSGQHVSFGTLFESSTVGSVILGIAQYSRIAGSLVIKNTVEVVSQSLVGQLNLSTDVTIGDDVEQIGFYIKVGGQTSVSLKSARAQVGTTNEHRLGFCDLTKLSNTIVSGTFVSSVNVSQNSDEARQTLFVPINDTGFVTAKILADRSANLSDVAISYAKNSVIFSGVATSSGFAVFDVDFVCGSVFEVAV